MPFNLLLLLTIICFSSITQQTTSTTTTVPPFSMNYPSHSPTFPTPRPTSVPLSYAVFPWKIQLSNTSIGCSITNNALYPVVNISSFILEFDSSSVSNITCIPWNDVFPSFPLSEINSSTTSNTTTTLYTTINCNTGIFQVFTSISNCVQEKNPIKEKSIGYITTSQRDSSYNIFTSDTTCRDQNFFTNAMLQCFLPLSFAQMEMNRTCVITPPSEYRHGQYRNVFLGFAGDCVPYQLHSTKENVWLGLPLGGERSSDFFFRLPERISIFPANRSCTGQPQSYLTVDSRDSHTVFEDGWPDDFNPDSITIDSFDPYGNKTAEWFNYMCEIKYYCIPRGINGIVWNDNGFCIGEVPYQAFIFLLVFGVFVLAGSMVGFYYRKKCCGTLTPSPSSYVIQNSPLLAGIEIQVVDAVASDEVAAVATA
jgi:hypothetical protein